MVEASPSSVQFFTSSSDITYEQELIDQMPIAGRNPYNLSSLDPSITVSPATSENRPYHHAYANDYDAGGGTRRANDVLLDGVALGASFKTAYTPAVDAVEEVTVSKNSVDAENGHSLGGIISLNMKSGTNQLRGSTYVYGRDPSMNSIADPTIRRTPGQDTTALRGTELRMYGGTIGGPIKRGKIFSFTSFEQWDDKRPNSIVRTVPTELERAGDFSQSVLNGRVRNIFNPFQSTVGANGLVSRPAFRRQRHPVEHARSGGGEDAGADPAAQPAGPRRQLAGHRLRPGRLLELLAAPRREHHRQLEGVRALRPVQGQPLPGQPDRRRLLPAHRQQSLRHERRRRLGVGHLGQDHPERPRQLLQHDRRVLQSRAAARRRGPERLLVARVVLVALQQRLRLLPGARRLFGFADRHHDQPPRPPGPRVVPASRRVDRVDPHEPLPGLAQHEVGRRDARLLRGGGAVRADQPGVQLDADRQQLGHPRRGQHRQPVGGVHARRARQPDLGPAGPAADAEPAGLRRLLPGRLGGDGPPHREPRTALGIRAGSDRQGQPLVAAARPDPADSRDGRDAAADAGAGPAAHGQQGLRLFVQRRVDLHHRRGPQRVGHLAVELHAAGRGELPPRRDHGGAGGLRPLPDADQQRPRHARRLRQPVHRLRADHDDARADQRPAEPDPGRSVPGGQSTR